MRLRVWIVVGILASATAGAVVQRGLAGGHSAAAVCSRAAASRAINRYRVVSTPPGFEIPVAQVLCGPFLGRGSRAMVASVATGSCGISIDWAVFRYAGGRWRLVLNVKHGAHLYAVGSDVRETIGVPRAGDSHCFPSRVKSRLWHWNGTRLRAGAFTTALSYQSVLAPDRKTWCGLSAVVPREAFCGRMSPMRLATLRPSGKFSDCEGNGCLQNWDDHAHVLKDGQADEWGGFSCLAQNGGVACTVIGGPAHGKGFLITASGVTAVAP